MTGPSRSLLAILLAGAVGAASEVAQEPLKDGATPNAGLATAGMDVLAGQKAVCARPREKTFRLTVQETSVELGAGTTFNAWAYDGRIPGPTIEVCVGDVVTIEVTNAGTTAHGLDTHALAIDSSKFGPTKPGAVMTISGEARTPGVFMYHCAAGPVTDYHIKSGLHGAMVVHPREPLRAASKELVVVESAIFGERSESGEIQGTDSKRTLKNDFEFRFFNGRLEHEPLSVSIGDLIRVYHVNIGPGVSATHVIGSMLERVVDGGGQHLEVQTFGVPPGGGAILEFRIPEAGDFLLVNHDQLGFVPIGLGLVFRTATR